MLIHVQTQAGRQVPEQERRSAPRGHAALLLAGVLAHMLAGAPMVEAAQRANMPAARFKEPVVMDVGARELALVQAKSPGRFETQEGLAIHVTSFAEGWELRCRATEAVAVKGGRSLGFPLLLPERDIENPGRFYLGHALRSDRPATIVRGGVTGPRKARVNTLRLRLDGGAYPAPGVYEGRLEFSLHPAGGRPIPGPEVDYRLEVPAYVDIRCEPEVMRFGPAQPGLVRSEKVRVLARTNHKELRVAFRVGDLLHEGGRAVVPAEAITLTALETRGSGAAREGGDRGRLVWVCRRGESSVDVQGAVKVDPTMPGGTYTGVINIDVLGQQ